MGSSRFVRKVAIGLLASGTVIGLTAAAGAASAAPQGRHPLDGSMPKWLHQARDMGASSTAQRMNFGVLLGMRDQAGAMDTLKAISDPASSSYGQWLTNAQFDARYAPAKSSVTAVQDWLRSEGFQVTKTLPSGMYVEASGSVAQVQSAFGTSVHNYSYLGKNVHANNSQLSLPTGTPAAVTSAISGVIGVDQGTALKHTAGTEPGPPPGARYGVQPCSAYYAEKVADDKPAAYGKNQPYTVCGYGPQQLQSAYGESSLLKSGIDGRGVTVAITDAYAAPTIYADAQKYNQVHHQPLFTPGQFSQIVPDRNGFDQVKLCGTDLPAKTVEFPADLPFVTGVGGSSVLVGSHGQWLGEDGWQTAYSTLTNGAWTPAPPGTYSSGGGGGTSQLFTQPFYQAGKVPASISEYYGSTPMRAVPDIAMDGDPNTGFLVGETQVFPDGTYWDQYRIGGTSLSSPLLAGVVAVASQAHHHPLGFINPLYYRLLGTSALHDTVAPTSPVAQVRTDYTNCLDNSQGKFWRLQTVDVQSSTLHDTPGYDNETGVGTPLGPAFFLRG